MKPERLLFSTLALFCLTFTFASGIEAAAKRPNVLLMMVDDMGWSDLGCYGGEIETPTLDRLAKQGMRFSQFYNTAKCAQTRASLLSGQYHNEVGIDALRNCWTLGEAMREAGYFTIMTGKWHLNKQPTDRGFDRYFGHLSGATDFFVGDNTFRLNGKPFTVPKSGFYTTDANTDYALQFIDESRKGDKPFFCYVAFNAPHYPLQAPKKDVEKYLGKYNVGWDEIRKRRYAKQQKLGILGTNWKLSPRPDDVPAWEDLDADTRQKEDLRMATFAAMVDKVDQNIARLVNHLKETGELDNTLILFLSDNGGCPFDRNNNIDRMPWEAKTHWTYDKGWAHACNTPFRLYKQNQHEGGISTPLIAHWPNGLKAEAGSITHQPGHLVDIMATMLDLTKTPYPASYNDQKLQPLRGKSLLPILAGQQREAHEALYFDFANKYHAVRMGKWKLSYEKNNTWELYDLKADRTELNDLSKQHPDRARKMELAWKKWAGEVGIKSKNNSNAPRKRVGKKAYMGHWSLTLPDGSAGWLGIDQPEGKLRVRAVWSVGGVRTLANATIQNGTLKFTPRKRRGSKQTELVNARINGNKLNLTLVITNSDGKVTRQQFKGKRQPPLPSKPDLSKVRFGKPITLFNGKDLTGWKLTNPKQINGWIVEKGVLVNNTPKTDFSAYSKYGNLRTEREFKDFQLHIEFRVPPNGNSGIYLRGLYEAQVLDRDSRMQGISGPGAVFSRIKPIKNAGKPGGEWQTYDITLVDRHITIVLNGEKVIDNEPLEGCTGGALFSDVTRAGPIYLQGDHTSIAYRNVVLRPVVK